MTTADPNHLKFPKCLFLRWAASISSSKPAELTKGSSAVEVPPKLWRVREIAVCFVPTWITIGAITTFQARSQYSKSLCILLWGQGAQRIFTAPLFQWKSNPFQSPLPIETEELKRSIQTSSVKEATIIKMTNLPSKCFCLWFGKRVRTKKILTILSFVLGGKFNHV